MDVRPYLTAGVAVASAGVLVAALPTVVAPATHPQVTVTAQVPKSVYADVALRQSVGDLIDAFFASGVPGVTEELLLALVGEGSPTGALITGFFNGDPNGGEFEYPGIPDVVRQILVAAAPGQAGLINGFFLDGGAPDVLRQVLVAAAPAQAGLINGFFNGDPNGGEFEYPGIPDVVRQLLVAAAPGQASLINGFFLDGGAPVVVGSLLLAGSDATFGDDSPVSGAITAFFTGYPPVAPDADPSPSGIPGLTHFIIDSLLGRVVKTPPDPEATTLAAARTAKSGATADLPEANEPIDSAAKTVTLTTAAPVKAKKSAAAAVAGKADPKDAQTPAVDPAASAVDPAAAEADDGAGKAEDVTDKIKDGNKTEVDPILLENHTGGGGLAEAIQTWSRFLQKLIGGGGSKKPATVNSTTPTTPKTPQELPEPVAALPSSK